MMESVRKDTITLVFGNEAKSGPSSGELCEWIVNELNVTLSELVCVEQEFGAKKVYLKLKSGERVLDIVGKDDGLRRFKFSDGKECDVTVSGSGLGVKYIRVRYLPTELGNVGLSEVLSEYGRVLNVEYETYGRNHVFKGVMTGGRIVKIALKHHIPSFIKVSGCEGFVRYFGQPPTCRRCGAPDHFQASAECPSRRREGGSYADRLAGRRPPVEPVFSVSEDEKKEEDKEKELEDGGVQDSESGWGLFDDNVLNVNVQEQVAPSSGGSGTSGGGKPAEGTATCGRMVSEGGGAGNGTASDVTKETTVQEFAKAIGQALPATEVGVEERGVGARVRSYSAPHPQEEEVVVEKTEEEKKGTEEEEEGSEEEGEEGSEEGSEEEESAEVGEDIMERRRKNDPEMYKKYMKLCSDKDFHEFTEEEREFVCEFLELVYVPGVVAPVTEPKPASEGEWKEVKSRNKNAEGSEKKGSEEEGERDEEAERWRLEATKWWWREERKRNPVNVQKYWDLKNSGTKYADLNAEDKACVKKLTSDLQDYVRRTAGERAAALVFGQPKVTSSTSTKRANSSPEGEVGEAADRGGRKHRRR